MKTIGLFFLFLFCNSIIYSQALKVGDQVGEITISDWIANVPDDRTLEGKAILLEFWATWCGPCIRAVPHLNELQAEYAGDNFLFLSMTYESQEKVERLLKKVDFKTIVVSDQSKKTWRLFSDDYNKLLPIPTTVLIDEEGRVKWIGSPEEVNTNLLDDFLAGKSIAQPEVQVMHVQIDTAQVIDKPKGKKIKKEVLYSFEIWEATEIYSLRKNVNDEYIHYTNLTLAEIFSKALKEDFNKINVDEAFEGKNYSFKYQNYTGQNNKLDHLKDEIIEVLDLQISMTSSMSLGFEIKIKDQSKLQPSIDAMFSSISEADSQLLLNKVTISTLVDEINKRTGVGYVFESEDEAYYDFIIDLSDEERLRSSIGTYGLIVDQKEFVYSVLNLEKSE